MRQDKEQIKEEDLYQPIKMFLEGQGYTVHSEVNYCDVTAIRGDELVIVELKKNLSVDLIIQGVLRQKLTPDVYVAVPKFKRMKNNSETNNIIYLMRRLELGLILVDIQYNTVEVPSEPKKFDLEKSRARNKKRVASVINEINKRSMDLNTGGSKGKKLVTAYREQAILVACILKRYGEQFPKEIRAKGGDIKKTLGILKNNYYNWFESLSNGKYALSEQGILELDDYKALSDVFFKKISEANKILYISDLDGTLLNSGAHVSERTAESLNEMIKDGLCFSVATARSPDTVCKILENVHINIPVVLMNGVLIYDLKSREYLKINSLSRAKSQEIVKVLSAFDVNFFMYTLDPDLKNTGIVTFYSEVKLEAEFTFLEERINDPERKFVKTNDYRKNANNAIYYSIINKYDILSEIFGKLSEVKGISMILYKDTYTEAWFLEIFSDKAGKKEGMEFVAAYANAKYTVAFGDNLNDIEFMQAANEAYAVSNAKEAVIKAAASVILSNDEDGVVKFIESREKE